MDLWLAAEEWLMTRRYPKSNLDILKSNLDNYEYPFLDQDIHM